MAYMQRIHALHRCIATKQAGQVADDEDEAEAERRTQETAASVRSHVNEIVTSWQPMTKETKVALARRLSSFRGISYGDAKRMVHRRDDYERQGRLGGWCV